MRTLGSNTLVVVTGGLGTLMVLFAVVDVPVDWWMLYVGVALVVVSYIAEYLWMEEQMTEEDDEQARYERDVHFAEQALDAAIATFGHAEVIRATVAHWTAAILAEHEPEPAEPF